MRRQKTGEDQCAARFSVSDWLSRLQVDAPRERSAGETVLQLEPFHRQQAKLLFLLLTYLQSLFGFPRDRLDG